MRTLLGTARFMSISTGPAYHATPPIGRPRLTLSSASCIDVGPPAHSRTESAPLPPVMSATRRARLSWRTLTMKSAPSRRSISRRSGRVPERITRSAPSALQSWTASRPMGPGPLDEHGLAGEVAPHEIDRPERGGRGGHHAGLLEREVIGKLVERVDVIHRVLGKTPVARHPLGPIALGDGPGAHTRRVPALRGGLAPLPALVYRHVH